NPEVISALQLFNLAARNGSDKLSRAEVNRLIAAGDRLVNCRAEITVADQGRGLFELLDRDGDGRLSPRELAAAPALLARLDRDGDGKLDRSELPRGYTVTVKAASIEPFSNGVSVGDLALVNELGRINATPARLPPDVPEWFRNADRNGDGDVSAKEFPGPPA